MPLRRCVRACTASLLAMWLGLAGAQAPAECPPPAPRLAQLDLAELTRQARDRGLLWRLDKDGRTSWLYGTLHVSRSEWAVPGPTVRRALLGSDVVALELDLFDPELPLVFRAAVDPARRARVVEGLQPRIDALSARACLSADRGAPSAGSPLLQVMNLSLQELRREGLHPELSVDGVLQGMARAAGKAVVGLETPAQQLAAFVPASEGEERALLERAVTVLESGQGRGALQRLVRAWASGEEAELASYPQWCECLETPAERNLMLRINDQRNPGLADKLAALHAERSFFAGVGALHMTGPQALPQLLAARGFRLQRIHFPVP